MFKTVFIGDCSVGKTSIANRLVKDNFSTIVDSTIGAAYLVYQVNEINAVNNEDKIKFEIWDTCGQERFRAIVPMYFKHADVIFYVCDTSNNDSILNIIKVWKPMVDEYLTSDRRELLREVLLVNKCDHQEGTEYLDSLKLAEEIVGSPVIYTSAKTSRNISEIKTILHDYAESNYSRKLVERSSTIDFSKPDQTSTSLTSFLSLTSWMLAKVCIYI